MELSPNESTVLLHMISQWPRPIRLWKAIQGSTGVAHAQSGETLFRLRDKRLIRVYHHAYLRLTVQGCQQAVQLMQHTQTLN